MSKRTKDTSVQLSLPIIYPKFVIKYGNLLKEITPRRRDKYTFFEVTGINVGLHNHYIRITPTKYMSQLRLEDSYYYTLEELSEEFFLVE